MHPSRLSRLGLGLSLALGCASASGAPALMLATFNQGTLARGFALPGLGAAAPLTDGEARWSTSLDLTTEYVFDDQGSESLLLDGETQRYALRYARGWSGGDWSLELPVLHVGGGFIDSFIEHWHDTFGLPNGGRELAPQDRYRYRYVRNGVTQFDVSDGGTELGDAQLAGGVALREQLMLRAQVKLPTGDKQHLTGGNWGGALWADAGLPFDETSAVAGTASLGVSLNEHADVLGALQNQVIPFGGIGLSYALLPRLQAIAQLYAHAPLYEHTQIDALRRPGLQLTMGGRWCAGSGPCFELSFQEDLVTESSPDFSLRFALLSP